MLPVFVEVGLCAIGEKDPQASSKSARAWSKLAAVPDVQSPGSEPG
jgi:hypothetical protein